MKPRLNPFASHRIDNLAYRLAGNDWINILGKLNRLNYRAAVIGPHGSGKTTFLEELATKLSAGGHHIHSVFINTNRPWMTSKELKTLRQQAKTKAIIFLDGADLLSWVQWLHIRFLVQQAKGLIITEHRPIRLPTLIQCHPSVEILDDMIGELCGPDGVQLRPFARTLFDRHRGNMHDVFRDLYMAVAG